MFAINHWSATTSMSTGEPVSNVPERRSKKVDQGRDGLIPVRIRPRHRRRTRVALEPDQEAADDALRRFDDQEFVVDRSRIRRIAEQVANADEDFPPRAADVEGQRLI